MVVKYYFGSQEESTETMDMTNDVHSDKQPRIDDDFIISDEEQRYQRAASLDKLVDYCVEEFGKPLFILHVVFFYIYSRTLRVLVGTFFLFVFKIYAFMFDRCSDCSNYVQKDDLFEKEAFVCKRFRLSYPDRPLKHGRVYKFIIHIRGVTNKNTFLLIALSRYRVATILFSSVEQKKLDIIHMFITTRQSFAYANARSRDVVERSI